MAEKQIGKVIHWYDKASVAVLSLTAPLAVGDNIKIVGGNREFEEAVSSMQVDHKPMKSVEKGEEVAVKLSQKAKEGSLIYKLA
ncbi:hypothetical protein A3B93_01585 [Candidatus Nomurabacteria bacterium RIFCSPHIGHO2_02_FULL_42_24]|uniref:Translation elongation factor-like protein n=1 Tax=Candidatus Nomurabacteria bacterium RIFCSPHIGHO2_02_FULL_42_24 TaxID=1801757 RepID=A0A1F6WIB6_9BACT|nr:MAG: hypothetical protein UV08_C0032G0016 [Parcubacteria group bacterium GW2011_GWA2_42_18]OGI81630.1 MAG: hypothetical protein A3B93_01585 [Candidatus Nomurabacteria bacterium RIFCSPHIGHO2_02_FULL_42_24]